VSRCSAAPTSVASPRSSSMSCGFCSDRLRVARRSRASATSKSRRGPSGEGRGGADEASARCERRKSPGSASSRARMGALAFNQARHSSPRSRLLRWSRTAAAARDKPASRRTRHTGSRCFITACAGRRPSRTCSWMASGISRIRPRCLDTQLALRPNRRASSSPVKPWRSLSSARSQPCSRALGAAPRRLARSTMSASATVSGHTTTDTRSRPRRRRARTRL